MDLSTLGSTLPPGLADAERDMGDKFRAAALSITNLYKSSLGYTKQAYNVGYSAALADVLSTVQSSIGAGQNAEQTLSRMMDWADARQAAISAFAAEDTDDIPPPISKRPQLHTTAKSTLGSGTNHLNAPNRPSSAPVGAASSTSFPVATSTSKLRDQSPIPDSSASSSKYIPNLPTQSTSTMTATTQSTPNTIDSPLYQPTPMGIMSSSPMASPSNRPMFNPLPSKPSKGLPNRMNHNQSGPSSSSNASGSNLPSTLPSTTFNPSIPSAGVPFVSFTQPNSNSADVPAQNYPTGTKRPMLDSMEVDQLPIQPTTNQVQAQTPTNNRSGRASKRRSMGNALNTKNDDVEEKDKDKDRDRDRERRKGSRRHGNGAGAGAV
ncbi:uncharacterized protein IL334_001882 [Kwoniella shivajii]|uniref:Uncharacterized protein n=1 Tax=Kwoniella shivajii TaxID=564305 RepID=A0ABZ1CT52_9TREE|nr:hypothetical protein IL334_001882 [Kwoniella shivajii]